jgi:hypothetical protein
MRKPVGPNSPPKAELPPHLTSIEVDAGVVKRLRLEAARRQLSVPALINNILAVTVEDSLTTAILDD